MRKFKFIAICIVGVLFLCNCATIGVKPYNEMTPRERALFLVTTYNKLDAEYRIQAIMPNLTDKDKEMLRVKKQIMTQLYPLIDAYRMAVENNVTVPPSLEPMIMNLLDQLGTRLGG